MSAIPILCSNTDWKPRRYDFQSDKITEVDYIDEDTMELQNFVKTLQGISKQSLKSYHLHNEYCNRKSNYRFKSGQNIAIITDAGTPEFSDQVISGESLCR